MKTKKEMKEMTQGQLIMGYHLALLEKDRLEVENKKLKKRVRVLENFMIAEVQEKDTSKSSRETWDKIPKEKPKPEAKPTCTDETCVACHPDLMPDPKPTEAKPSDITVEEYNRRFFKKSKPSDKCPRNGEPCNKKCDRAHEGYCVDGELDPPEKPEMVKK